MSMPWNYFNALPKILTNNNLLLMRSRVIRRTPYFLTSLFLLAGLVSNAGAALLSLNDPQFGQDSITRDTATGLDWLDVTESQGLSFQTVQNQTAAGGTFAGFRHATRSEIFTLWNNAGIPDTSGAVTQSNFQPIRDLQQLLGRTTIGTPGTTFEDVWLTQGLFNDTQSFTGVSNADLGTTGPNNPIVSERNTGFASITTGVSPTSGASPFGNWLVRADSQDDDGDDDVTVPEPSTLLLLLTAALAGFGVNRGAKE